MNKQETLEEAAEIWINNRFTKQICGDKSYPDIYASKKSIIESHIIFAKSQGKIMYSEEDMIEFVEWKDENFLMYRDKTYYAKTSSQYFDVTKHVGKEKPTKYYTLKELLQQFKKK